MKKEIDKKGIYILISLIFTILLISTVSAEGFWDWFKKTITGKASTTPTFNTSITFVGIEPISNIKVWNATLTGGAVTPVELGFLNISFNVSITDEDGAGDINDSSVKVEFAFGSAETKQNTTACSKISGGGESNASTQNYSCSIAMVYYDAPGAWQINVSATDLGNKTYYENSSMNFTYALLEGIAISPATITWPDTSPGSIDVTSNQNTTVNNTGNFNCTNLSVTGVHLYGATTHFLEIANFTSSINSTTADTCNNGNTLINGTAQQISVANVSAGNLSLGGGVAQEIIYYCIDEVPTGLPSQAYSTSEAGSKAWTITMA